MALIFRNPVLSDDAGRDHGDPFVLRYLGTYYLYHTGRRGVQLYTSPDLVNWEYAGTPLRASELPDHWAQTDLWAPEVLYYRGTFYMYVAGTRLAENGRGDDTLRRQGLARSDSPAGPFVWDDKPLIDEWSIDGHPYQDPDGSLWLYYNVRTEATRYADGTTGCGNVVQRLAAPDMPVGKQVPVAFPSERWEGNSEGTWYWNEGACVLKRRDTYYQMYSGGWFGDGTYAIGFATAPSHRGPWRKYAENPIFRSTQQVVGPGHHCVTVAPDGATPYVVYHAHVPGLRGRKVHIDRLYWVGDRPAIAGPTAGDQPYPPRAVFADEIPHWQLSAWVKGRSVTVGGVAVDLTATYYQRLEVTRRGERLLIAVDGVAREDKAVPRAEPRLLVDGRDGPADAGAVCGLTVTSFLDDDTLYDLAPGDAARWPWGGSCRTEVALAVKGAATVRVHGGRSLELDVTAPHRYELVRFTAEDGLDLLEVVAGAGGAQVADVMMAARE